MLFQHASACSDVAENSTRFRESIFLLSKDGNGNISMTPGLLPFYVARVFGLAPVIFSCGLQRSRPLWWSSLALLLFMDMVCFWHAYFQVSISINNHTSLTRTVLWIREFLFMGGASFSDVFIVRRQFAHLSEILDSQVFRTRSRITWYTLLPFCATLMLCIWITSLNAANLTHYGLVMDVTTKLKMVQQCVESYVFVCTLQAMYVRYQDLNLELISVLSLWTKREDLAKYIAQLRWRHREATDLLQKICFVFGPQIAITMLTKGASIILNMYVLADAQPSRGFPSVFVTTLIFTFVLSSDLLLIIWAADCTAEEGNAATHHLHKLLNSEDLSQNVALEVNAFCTQLTQYPVRVSLCRLFTLNLQCTLQVVSSAVTYFIALLQFRDATPLPLSEETPCVCTSQDIYSAGTTASGP